MEMKILLTEQIRPAGLAVLEKEASVTIAPDPRPETIIALASEYDGIISRNTYIGEEIFSKAPRLKVVASHGVGTDHIDLHAATKHGVYVVNTPGANAESVAEVVAGFMLCLSRKLIASDYAMRVNKDYYYRNQLIGRDLNHKTIGIIGMGQIGRRLARICVKGFMMNVEGYDPYLTEEEMKEHDVKKINDIDELLKNADYVSLNCPYAESLCNLINERRLKLMKPSAYLINCARGHLIDQSALFTALNEGTIAGAAVDVYTQEPPNTDSPLFALKNLIATPHIAANAEDSIDNMSIISAQDIIHVLKGEYEIANVVNRDVLHWENGRILPNAI